MFLQQRRTFSSQLPAIVTRHFSSPEALGDPSVSRSASLLLPMICWQCLCFYCRVMRFASMTVSAPGSSRNAFSYNHRVRSHIEAYLPDFDMFSRNSPTCPGPQLSIRSYLLDSGHHGFHRTRPPWLDANPELNSLPSICVEAFGAQRGDSIDRDVEFATISRYQGSIVVIPF